MRDIRNLIKRGCSNHFYQSTYKDKNNQLRPCFKVTQEGCNILNQSYKNKTLAEKCGNVFVGSFTRFELTFGSLLIEQLNELGIEVKTQHAIEDYRIDFYLPQFNLAIEYDEEQHRSKKSIIADTKRESIIRNKLKCNFIRLDYETSDAKNAAKIFKYILNYHLNGDKSN